MTKTNNNKWLNEQSQAHHVQRAKSELKIKNNNGIKREWKKGNNSTQQKSTTIYLCKSHTHTHTHFCLWAVWTSVQNCTLNELEN